MQGFNMGRYVPPDLEGTTSFNSASGKGHALGARARKLKSEGVLVVRFECPFAIWCTNCSPEQIIGQGVRFNAEKKKVGNYHSTPIWSFTVKHTVCGRPIEVRTDPRNAEYVVVSGGRRRDTGVDKLLDGEVRVGATEEEKAALEQNGGFGLLEKALEDKKEADTQRRRLADLTQRSERDWADPYEMSRRLRKEFRVGRRQRQADAKSGESLQEKFGLGVDVLPPSELDAERAAIVDFGEVHTEKTSSRPMFVTNRSPTAVLPQVKPSTDRGKRGKGDVVESGHDESRREMLRNTLRGNTRAGLDPFLADNKDEPRPRWRPNFKRQKLNDGKCDGDNDDEDANRSTLPSKQDEKRLANNVMKRPTLVGYESDSS